MSWQSGRPIFDRLPIKGYQDNDVVDWLTLWIDQKLVEKKVQLETIYQKLDPSTTSDDWLDFLAFLVGLSGNYWDTKWSSQVKRSLIIRSSWLWANRGTLRCIKEVLVIHQLTHSIWSSGALRLPITLPATFGRDDLRFYIRLPLSYQRANSEYKEAQRTFKNFAPAIVKGGVCYERFYLGYSRIGEPLFRD